MDNAVEMLQQEAASRGWEPFVPASNEAIDSIVKLGYPTELIDLYKQIEPDRDFGAVRLLGIAEGIEENTEAVPGIAVFPHGYVVFALTGSGSTYCLDTTTENEIAPVAYLSDEEIEEGCSAHDVARAAELRAESLAAFLEGVCLNQYLD